MALKNVLCKYFCPEIKPTVVGHSGMSTYEIIAQIEEWYSAQEAKHRGTEDPLEKAEIFGLLKGYKSTLILLRTQIK